MKVLVLSALALLPISSTIATTPEALLRKTVIEAVQTMFAYIAWQQAKPWIDENILSSLERQARAIADKTNQVRSVKWGICTH